MHQRQDLPQHIYGGANAVAGNPYEVPGPRYIENYSSPPMPHQMVPHLQSKGYPPPQQAPAPSAMYQRAGLKRTRSPSRDPRAKSSFFD